MTPIRQTKPRLTDSPDWTGWKAFFERQKAERDAGNIHNEKPETVVK